MKTSLDSVATLTPQSQPACREQTALYELINEWLEETVTQSSSSYTHRLLKEQAASHERVKEQLRMRVEKGHADMIRHLRKATKETLDPLGKASIDPADGYPWRLPPNILKGYLGELLAAVVAEEVSHFGIDGWVVPISPFRLHGAVFPYLAKLRQGIPAGLTGRDGDDMLAFLRDTDGRISKSLVCEAKCSNTHDSDLIGKAHSQISEQAPIPVDTLRLSILLGDYNDDESLAWQRALASLYSSDGKDKYQRYDLVCYVCGQIPVRGQTWIKVAAPHPKYQGGRCLEAVEIHLYGIDELVAQVYQPSKE